MKINKTKIALFILAIVGSLYGIYHLTQAEQIEEVIECECERLIEETPFYNIP